MCSGVMLRGRLVVTAGMGVKKVLVVSGHSSARKSGLLDRVLVSIVSAGVEAVEPDRY